MTFPQQVPHKLSSLEMKNVNDKICNMDADQSETFNALSKPNQTELQYEIAILTSMMANAFYPVPAQASAPVLKIYQRALELKYRNVRTTLALIKYYICPTLKHDMEQFFIQLVFQS